MPPFFPSLYQHLVNTTTRFRLLHFFRINVHNKGIEGNYIVRRLAIPEGLRHWPSSTVWNLPLAGSRPDAGQRMKIGDNASRSFFFLDLFGIFFASDRAGPHVLNIPHGSSSRTTAHFDFPHFFLFLADALFRVLKFLYRFPLRIFRTAKQHPLNIGRDIAIAKKYTKKLRY